MNKEEIIKHCSSTTGLTQKNIRVVLEALLSTIKLQIAQGNPVSLYGFGKFEITEYPSKKYYKPGSDEPIIVSGSKIPKFKASKDFKALLNK